MTDVTAEREKRLEHATDRTARSLQAICFLCFAIGLAVAPLFARLIYSVQYNVWVEAALWGSILLTAMLILASVVRRQVDRVLGRE